jgi:hypothetical protein
MTVGIISEFIIGYSEFVPAKYIIHTTFDGLFIMKPS